MSISDWSSVVCSSELLVVGQCAYLLICEFAEIGDGRIKIVAGDGLWLRTIGKGRGAIVVAALDDTETCASNRCPTGPGGGMLFLVTGHRFGPVCVEDRHADLLDRDLDPMGEHERVGPVPAIEADKNRRVLGGLFDAGIWHEQRGARVRG